MSAYQAEWESEALCSELEMMPPIPRLVPICFGESDTRSATTPRPPTNTSPNGSSQMKSR